MVSHTRLLCCMSLLGEQANLKSRRTISHEANACLCLLVAQLCVRAAATVALFVAVSVALEVREWDQNFFQAMEVPRGLPRHAYHKAYKV